MSQHSCSQKLLRPHIFTLTFLRLCSHDQHLSTEADVQTVKKHSSNELEKIIYEEKNNDHQVI